MPTLNDIEISRFHDSEIARLLGAPTPAGMICRAIWPILSLYFLPKGSFSETNGFSMIFLKFWKIAANLPRSDATLLSTLIAAGNSPFLASF